MADETNPTKKTITIAGEQFEVSLPYAEGHACTAAEAKALNQVRSENIRNNMSKIVKEAKENGDLNGATAKVAEYDTGYEFTLASVGGGRKMDPVEKEARVLARDAIRQKLADEGRKISEVPKEKLAEAIAKVAETDDFVKAAKKRVADRAKLAESSLEAIGM